MRVTALSVVLAVTLAPATALADDEEGVASAAAVYTFEDGYRAVLYPMPAAQTVAVWSAYDRGWSDDPEDFPGAAHLVEHLWFRSRMEDGSLWDGLQDRGCAVNGHTSPSRTTFETACASDALPYLLTAHASLAEDPLQGVTEAEVALENRVVRFEEAEREGWSILANRVLLRQLLAEDHPLHEVWAAPELDREPVSLAEATEWVKQAHTPDTTTLVVTGRFDRQVVLATLQEAHGASTLASDLTSGGTREAVKPPVSKQRAELEAPAPFSALLLGWTLPVGASNAAAGDAFAERLSYAMIDAFEDDDTVLSSGCGYTAHARIGTLTCTVSLGPEHVVTRVEADVRRALEQATSGKSKRAVRKQLRDERNTALSELRSMDRIPDLAASRLVIEVLSTGRASGPADLARALQSWKPTSGVGNVASLITEGRMASVLVMPSESVEPLADPGRADPIRPDRADMPELGVELPDAPAATRTLDSGLTLVAVQQVGAGRTLASLRFAGGLSTFPTGLTWIADRVSGTGSHLSTGGIVTGESVGRDHAEVYAWADPGREKRAMKQLYQVIVARGPGFSSSDRGAVEAFLDRELAQRRALAEEPAVQAMKALLDATVPDHGPSHGPSDADLEAMRTLDPGAVMAYVVQTYQPANGVLTLTGPQPPDELLDLAESVFSDWRALPGIASGGPMRSTVAAPATPIQGFIEDPRSRTATVRASCRLPDGTPRGVSAVVQELLMDRAFVRTRETTGWTYSPGVSVSAWPDGTTSAHVSIGARASEAGSVLRAVEDLTRAPTSAELERLKTRALRRIMARRDNQVSTEVAVFVALREGGEATTPLAFLRSDLEGVARAQVTDALRTCQRTRSWVVTGPADTRTSLRQAGRTTEAP